MTNSIPASASLEGLEITEFIVSDIDESATATDVTYFDNQGLSYKRTVHVPRNTDGEINNEFFEEILYSQLLGVNQKRLVGAALFEDLDLQEQETNG